jgi:hypothetical protein
MDFGERIVQKPVIQVSLHLMQSDRRWVASSAEVLKPY